MTLPKLTFFFTCLSLRTVCKAQIKLPKNLDESILCFQQQLTPAELDNFKNKPEENAVIELHRSTGKWIRNNWLYGDRDTALRNSLLSRWLAKYEQQSHELSLIGLTLCADKNDELVGILELDFAGIHVVQSS